MYPPLRRQAHPRGSICRLNTSFPIGERFIQDKAGAQARGRDPRAARGVLPSKAGGRDRAPQRTRLKNATREPPHRPPHAKTAAATESRGAAKRGNAAIERRRHGHPRPPPGRAAEADAPRGGRSAKGADHTPPRDHRQQRPRGGAAAPPHDRHKRNSRNQYQKEGPKPLIRCSDPSPDHIPFPRATRYPAGDRSTCPPGIPRMPAAHRLA